MEKTLSIIKPDAVARGHIGDIIKRFENADIKIINMKMLSLSKKDASAFYEIHKDRPFFDDLTNFISSGPVVVMVLEGQDVVKRNRDLMGATNPAEALAGTIRKDFAESIDRNAVHGSDSISNAIKEIEFFFKEPSLVH